jgi:hypothetical protein
VEVVSVLAGVTLLTLVMVDVFVTVFIPRGRPGPITKRLYRHLWRAWRSAVDRTRGQRRRRLLALAGPILLPLTTVVWALGLVTSFTLIYLPFGEAFEFPSSSDASALLTAAYFSAYSATTLGVGDVYASSPALRILSVTEAAMGFAVFTVAITYLLSVFNALQRSTSLALEVSRYLHARSDDALETFATLLAERQDEELSQWLGQVSSRLVETTQAQEQYPVLEYFHVPDDDRALPVASAELLEVLTACLAVLDPSAHSALAAGHRVRYAFHTAARHATERAAKVAPGFGPRQELPAERLAQYERIRGRLNTGAATLRHDDEARTDFVALRERWDQANAALNDHFGYQRATG